MIITFPHLGNTYICAKVLLDEFKLDYIIPSFNSKRAIELGSRHCPECACLPLKINIGNYIESYEKGADTILMAGGYGPCRFGYYCEIEKEIMADIGKKMNMLTLEAPDNDFLELIRRISSLSKGFKPFKTIQVLFKATRTSINVDKLEKLSFKKRCIELNKGETDKIYDEFRARALNSVGYKEISKLIKETVYKLNKVKTNDNKRPLKVGIVGEIYTTIDSSTNFNIESKLGNMGVLVDRAVTVSGWIVEHMLKNAVPFLKDKRYKHAAKPYLKAMIGGHAQETIGNTVLYNKLGYDGIIQIYPLTCMPEIVAQSILTVVSNDLDIPVLTLLIDEMTGEAGYLTRVEAFVDMLEIRRRTQMEKTEAILT